MRCSILHLRKTFAGPNWSDPIKNIHSNSVNAGNLELRPSVDAPQYYSREIYILNVVVLIELFILQNLQNSAISSSHFWLYLCCRNRWTQLEPIFFNLITWSNLGISKNASGYLKIMSVSTHQ